ncbi:MAG: VWA domain-containing protein, partial [Acidobacteriota bacterium]
IYATALDRYGEMVLDLDRSNFQVFDDGRRQELMTFVKGLQPITAALLMDMSASMTLNLDLQRDAAEQFVIRMLPGDRAMTGAFSDRVDIAGAVTADRDALLHLLGAGFHIGNPTKLWDAVDETMTGLTSLGGRRVILLMTDGNDTASRLRAADVLARARVDELMIYVVQFRTTPRANLAEQTLAPTAGEVFSGGTRNPPPPAALRRLATQTGGGHFTLGEHDDVNTTFTHVMQELHYQYVLGFAPQRADGRIHTIDVRVDRPGVTVRARGSYLAPRPAYGVTP